MKTRTCSQIPLIVGLAVALLGVWAVASPTGTTGDLVTGGTWFYECYVQSGDYIGVDVSGYTWSRCPPCSGTTQHTYCGDDYDARRRTPPPYYTCGGGPITIMIYDAGGDTAYAYSSTPCTNPPNHPEAECEKVHDAWCDAP